MKQKRHSEEQIVSALRQAEGGEKVVDICRKLGVSEQTFYVWRKKYAGMEAGQAHAAGGVGKKRLKPRRKRALAGYLQQAFAVSERRACGLVVLWRSSYRYGPRARDRTSPVGRLRELAAVRVRFGYRRLHVLLRREDWRVNHKRIYRLDRQEGLEIRTRKRKKLASRARDFMPQADAPNERWSMDFMADPLADGGAFRVLTVVDQFGRECPLLVADFSLSGKKVATALDRLAQERGVLSRFL
jgi:putative transposase